MKIGKAGLNPAAGAITSFAPLGQHPTLFYQRLVRENGMPSGELIGFTVTQFRINLSNNGFFRIVDIATAPEKEFLSALKTRTLEIFDRYFAAGCSQLIEDLKGSAESMELYVEHCPELDDLANGAMTLEQQMLSASGSGRVYDEMPNQEDRSVITNQNTRTLLERQAAAIKTLMLNAVSRHNALMDLVQPVIVDALTDTINIITSDPSQYLH